MKKTLIPPSGLGYQLECVCAGVYLPGDNIDPPVLGGNYACPELLRDGQTLAFRVTRIWSIL